MNNIFRLFVKEESAYYGEQYFYEINEVLSIAYFDNKYWLYTQSYSGDDYTQISYETAYSILHDLGEV